MINLNTLNRYRETRPEKLQIFYGWAGDHTCGAFYIPSMIDKQPLIIIASNGDGWDHVSVSRKNRCPNWAEMEFVFRLFFAEGETAMQLHVPQSDHVNYHPYCLHLWRPHSGLTPRPPSIFVGPSGQPTSPDSAAYKSEDFHSPELTSSPPDQPQSQ